MEPEIKPSKDKVARKLAQDLGRAVLKELLAAKQLHEYSKVIPLAIPKDVFERNLAIHRRRWHVRAQQRAALHQELKKHIGLP